MGKAPGGDGDRLPKRAASDLRTAAPTGLQRRARARLQQDFSGHQSRLGAQQIAHGLLVPGRQRQGGVQPHVHRPA